jgi:hypothetical protein
MGTAFAVLAAGMILFAVAFGLALWSERQREARFRIREERERAIAASKRVHPSAVGRGLDRAA